MYRNGHPNRASCVHRARTEDRGDKKYFNHGTFYNSRIYYKKTFMYKPLLQKKEVLFHRTVQAATSIQSFIRLQAHYSLVSITSSSNAKLI